MTTKTESRVSRQLLENWGSFDVLEVKTPLKTSYQVVERGDWDTIYMQAETDETAFIEAYQLHWRHDILNK